jgi:hypothetical protein
VAAILHQELDRAGQTHIILIACLGDLVVFGWIRFARNAREAGVPGFRRPDDPDWRATLAPASSLVRIERRLQPLGYRAGSLAAITPQEPANVFTEFYWHEPHGLMRLAL